MVKLTEHRWVAQLANYDFAICHKLSPTHNNAGAHSRVPGETSAWRVRAAGYFLLEKWPEVNGWAESQSIDGDLALKRQWQQLGMQLVETDPEAFTFGMETTGGLWWSPYMAGKLSRITSLRYGQLSVAHLCYLYLFSQVCCDHHSFI